MKLTSFQINSTKPNEALTSPRSFLLDGLTLSITLVAVITAAAAPPAALTEAQLQELDRLAAPMQEKIAQEQQDSQKILDTDNQRSKSADENMRPFLTSIGKKSLLEPSPQILQAAPPSTPVKEDTPSEPADNADPKNKKPETTTLRVECDGGLYFDSENGVLAYLKNIRLTEPRFNLTCSDELKVFLEQKPKTDSDTTAKSDDKTSTDKDTKKKDKSLSSFGDLQRIVASGNVKVTQKDDQGRLFIASGGTASYNAKTGEMILKGGLPRLQQSANQYLQAQEPGQWIRIHKNGKLVTSKGKWRMETIIKKPAPKKPSTP